MFVEPDNAIILGSKGEVFLTPGLHAVFYFVQDVPIGGEDSKTRDVFYKSHFSAGSPHLGWGHLKGW